MEFHRSLWQTLVPPEAEPLRTGIDAEVLIIGSGIAGLLTAKKLTDYGVKNIAVIDAGPLCGNVTAHTTAKVTAQHGLCYRRLRDNFGVEKAAAYAAGNNQAVEQWAAIAATIPDASGTYSAAFTRCPAVIYTRDDKRRKEFEKELDAAAEAGLDVSAVDDLPLPFETAAAIQLSNQAHVHPLEFCYGLIRQLMEQGVVFCPHTQALPPEAGDLPGRIAVLAGGIRREVRAQTVVCATHFPFMDKSALFFARIYQERSYALAVEGVSLPAMYLGVDGGASSFRPYIAGGKTGIILGGAGHKTGHEENIDHYGILKSAAAQWYPEQPVTARWSAQDCMTHDGVPFAGRYKQLDDRLAPRVYLATGFGKWGMTQSMAAAGVIADGIFGKDNPLTDVYDPSRVDPIAKAKQFVVQNADMTASLVSGLLHLPQKTLDDVAPGEGKIVKTEQGKAGVYRHPDGRVSAVQATCTHMGCELTFNAGDRSWDCPCHGSRFDIEGKVLNNPAAEDLRMHNS